MDISIIISLVTLAGVLIKASFDRKDKKETLLLSSKKIDSDIMSTEITIAKELLDELRLTVEEHKHKINDLIEEINALKQQEKFDKLEKIRLEEKIRVLSDENNELKKQIKGNQTEYKKQIAGMKEQITKLRAVLKKYTDEHPEKNN